MLSKETKYAKSNKIKKTLTVVGKTEDGKLVVSGVFEIMSSTTGLPLEIILEILNKHNMIISWIDFYNSSIKHKWKWRTTKNRIETSVNEIFGKEYTKEILKRLEFYKKYLKH